MRERSSLLAVMTVLSACALALAAVFLAGGPQMAGAHQADRDCPEFPDQAAAQRFFVSHGGSRSNNFDDLDGNGDGIACNELPCPCSRADGGGEAAAAVPPGHRIPARVTHVTDGDTVDVTFASGASLAVRVIGIDTPEEYRPATPVECGARAAARSMASLAEGAHVTLLTDYSQARFDRYGRLLAYVERGHRDLGKLQIRRGWATTYVYEDEPFARLAAYRSVQAKARSEGAGVWSRCGGDFHSAEPRRQD
jgi:endonuclease YncB( thermonuclease family)